MNALVKVVISSKNFPVPDITQNKLKERYPTSWSCYHDIRWKRCKPGMVDRLHADWDGSRGFHNFLGYLGPRPSSEYSVERPESKKTNVYGPGYCVWADKATQSENRSCVRVFTDNNCIKYTLKQIHAKFGTSIHTLRSRMKRGKFTEHEIIHGREKSFSNSAPANHCPGNSEIECTAGGKPDMDTNSVAIPPAINRELIDIYTRAMARGYNLPAYSPTPTDRKILKGLPKVIEEGGLPAAPVVAVIVQDWQGFMSWLGQFIPEWQDTPGHPEMKFTQQYAGYMGSYFLHKGVLTDLYANADPFLKQAIINAITHPTCQWVRGYETKIDLEICYAQTHLNLGELIPHEPPGTRIVRTKYLGRDTRKEDVDGFWDFVRERLVY